MPIFTSSKSNFPKGILPKEGTILGARICAE